MTQKNELYLIIVTRYPHNQTQQGRPQRVMRRTGYSINGGTRKSMLDSRFGIQMMNGIKELSERLLVIEAISFPYLAKVTPCLGSSVSHQKVEAPPKPFIEFYTQLN